MPLINFDCRDARLIALAVVCCLCACESSPDATPTDRAACSLPVTQAANGISRATVTANPSGLAPLTARIELDLSAAAIVRLTVRGKNGAGSDVVQTTSDCKLKHSIDVVGLYANELNAIDVELLNGGLLSGSDSLTVGTPQLPAEFPSFEILQDYPAGEKGFFLVNFRPFNRPLIVDRFGDIRWYLDVEGVKYGLQVLRNGNFAFGTRQGQIEEYSPLGELLNSWSVLPEFEDIHHDLFEMDSGNFLATVNKAGIDTIEDFVIEVDRTTGAVVTVWDLREILPRRTTFYNDPRDWFHNNAVIHDSRDDSIIVSGQRQGLVKVTRDNQLRWILAPPEGWDGYEDHLLTPPPSGEFEWNWGQHAPALLPDGDILLFDNGLGREYGTASNYSRAVRYRISENAGIGGAVQQIWQYGKQRGDEMHSPIISDVDFLEDSGNVLITAGALGFEFSYVSPDERSSQWIAQLERARIIEVAFDGVVAFEMVVNSTTTNSSVYRSEKMPLFNTQ